MKIRKATLEDIKYMVRLNDSHPSFSSDSNHEWNKNSYERVAKKCIEEDNYLALVCEHENKVIAYLYAYHKKLHPSRKTDYLVEIESMAVDKNFHRQGIGSKLIEEAEKWAKEKGVTRMQVGTYAKNETAINFYEKNSFEKYKITLEKDI